MNSYEQGTLFGSEAPYAAEPAPAPQSRPHRLPQQLAAVVAALMLIAGVAGYELVSKNNGTSPVKPLSASTGPMSDGSASDGSATGSGDDIAAKVGPAIVDINTKLGSSGAAAGTGMIIDASGEILTNNHVVAGATSITVTLTSSGTSYPATLVGYDASHDVAVLKIDNVSGLPTIHTASASTASVGDTVVAIGNALGKGGQPSVVQGQIADVNQTITAGDEGGSSSETLHGLLEMTAPIQPGDSGGATVDSAGNVIGMTTAGNTGVETTSSQAATIGYAVPIDDALTVAKAIMSGDESGTVHLGLHGQLGVSVGSANGDGVAVTGVKDGSAAANAGLAQGDVITAVNDQPITSTNDLNNAMTATHVGDTINITFQDASGSAQSATATLTVGVG